MNDIFWDQHFGDGLDWRYAEQVTPAFSVRDSEGSSHGGCGDLHFLSRTSCMLPQCLALGFFCCHTLLGAWRPWPLERILLSRHGFVGVAVLIRRAAGRSRHTMLSRGSVLVELEAVLYSDAGEACTTIDTSRKPPRGCVALPRC